MSLMCALWLLTYDCLREKNQARGTQVTSGELKAKLRPSMKPWLKKHPAHTRWSKMIAALSINNTLWLLWVLSVSS